MSVRECLAALLAMAPDWKQPRHPSARACYPAVTPPHPRILLCDATVGTPGSQDAPPENYAECKEPVPNGSVLLGSIYRILQ